MNHVATLFDRLGGQPAVDAAVEIFYQRVLADPVVNGFFANTNMDSQRRKQQTFMTMAFGGPSRYAGKDMRAAHAHLDLTDAHFDAIAGHLKATLEQLGVAPDLVGDVLSIVETTRTDVLNR